MTQHHMPRYFSPKEDYSSLQDLLLRTRISRELPIRGIAASLHRSFPEMKANSIEANVLPEFEGRASNRALYKALAGIEPHHTYFKLYVSAICDNYTLFQKVKVAVAEKKPDFNWDIPLNLGGSPSYPSQLELNLR